MTAKRIEAKTGSGGRRHRRLRVGAAAASALILATLLSALVAAPAAAEQVRLPLETFGSAAQPTFGDPQGLAVDQSTGEVYVAEAGLDEVQEVTVAATAGTFTLSFEGETTAELPFDASAQEVREALTALATIPDGQGGIETVSGGPGDATGTKPYRVSFWNDFAKRDLPQLGCEDGATPLSGGAGCSVATTTEGVPTGIHRFHADGTPSDFPALGTNVIDGRGGADETPQGDIPVPHAGEGQLAIDESGGPTDGDLYWAGGNARLYVFSGEGALLASLDSAGSNPFAETTCGAGVDAGGAVYLGNGEFGRVYRFVPTASPLTKDDYEAPFFNFTIGSRPCSLAAGAGLLAGHLFVAKDGTAEPYPGITKWDVAGRQMLYQVAPNPLSGIFSVIALNPASGHLFVAPSSPNLGTVGRVTEYDVSGSEAASLVSVAKRAVAGIAVRAATDHLYISRGNGEGIVEVYGPAVTVPTLANQEAAAISPTGATLHGTVNPEGLALAECEFEYLTRDQWQADGRKFDAAATVPCQPEAGAIPADSAEHALSAPLAGLDPGTRYVFRLAAANANGANVAENTNFTGFGTSELEEKGFHFKTAAPVATAPADPVAGTRATLNGVVFPQGEAISECRFEYGETTAYGQSVACDPEASEIPADEGEHKVSAEIDHLVPNGTTYHFRLTATGGFGTIAGSNLSFKTKDTVITKAATSVGTEAARLNGTINPEGIAVGDCRFEYAELASFEAEGFEGAPSIECAEGEGEIGTGFAPVSVHADLAGLQPSTSYRFRLVATNEDGTAKGATLGFKTLGPPLIEAQWAVDVTTIEATLRAEINPEGLPTTYRLEYGTDTGYGEGTAELSLGAEDRSAHVVTRFLQGLAPGTTYHYRFVATNEIGETEGPDRSFATYAPPTPDSDCPNQAFRTGPAARLPDCRGYELVSPLDKNGGGVALPGGPPMPGRASLDGERLAYGSVSAFAGARTSNFANQYIATRAAGGWSTEAIAPRLETPGVRSDPFGVANTFFTYSADLCSAWLLNENPVPLSAAAQEGESNLYRRRNCGPGAGGFEALTIAPPSNEVPGGMGPGLAGNFVGAAADLSHQLFETTGALTPEAASTGKDQLYDLSGGALHLVSVLPDGSAAEEGASAGAAFYISTSFGRKRGAIAADGSRVFWTDQSGSAPLQTAMSRAVYVRQNPAAPESEAKDGEGNCLPEAGRACTIQLSPGADSAFLSAARDGSRALLRSGDSLEVVDAGTGAATTIAAGLPDPSVNVSAFTTGFLGAADDLSRIYFVSAEALAPGATAGADNLYAYHEDAYTLIGTLAAADLQRNRSPAALSANVHDAHVSPDGTHLAFPSHSAALAAGLGYDNADRATGEPDREAYLYDATANGGEGELRCVSCNPSGARPRGGGLRAYGKIQGEVAATLPTEPSVYHAGRPLSSDGSRVFFEAFDALLPSDTNGTWDVYQWEEPGAGSCEEADPDYFELNRGCINLISTGQSPEPTQLFEADPSGRNVFIRTTAGIDPRDEGAYDIYVARVNGGFPLPAPAAECEGEACQSPAGPPDDPSPASSAYRGPGNAAQARRGCRGQAARARKLSRRAKRLRRAAKRAKAPARRRAMRRRAKGAAKRAQRSARRARRCRGAKRGKASNRTNRRGTRR